MKKNNRATPFCIRIADMVIRIEPLYNYIQVYCAEYLTKEEATFTVRVNEEDIVFERERSVKDTDCESRTWDTYPDAYLETLAVYRRIAEYFPLQNIMLFHGSVIAVDGKGYLFIAKSGTGKSTHTGLWRKLFGSRAVMVNDDKPLLKITNEGVWAYGTPWDGKHRLSTNMSVPLKAICVLTRSADNHIEQIQPKEAYQMLLQQSYRPMDRLAMMQTLMLIDEMMKETRFYRLGCNMDPEAAKVAYEGMRGTKWED